MREKNTRKRNTLQLLLIITSDNVLSIYKNKIFYFRSLIIGTIANKNFVKMCKKGLFIHYVIFCFLAYLIKKLLQKLMYNFYACKRAKSKNIKLFCFFWTILFLINSIFRFVNELVGSYFTDHWCEIIIKNLANNYSVASFFSIITATKFGFY